jgi:hypothetical protein
MAAELEKAAGEVTASGLVEPLLNDLRSELDAFGQAVATIAATTAAKSPATVDHAQSCRVLERLVALLAIEDSAANDEFDQARDLLTAAFGAQARLLGRQIESFDYSEALDTATRSAAIPVATRVGGRLFPCPPKTPSLQKTQFIPNADQTVTPPDTRQDICRPKTLKACSDRLFR